MAHFTDLSGLAGIALALAMLCHLMPGCRPLGRGAPMAIAGAVFVLLLVPFTELPLAAYVRGMVGDPSITTLVLLGYAVAQRNGVLPGPGTPRRIGGLLLLVLAGCVLYPLALGAAPYDTYRWGYGDPCFLGLLLALALAGVVWRMPLITLSISLAVLAWAAGWYESGNLWDYLIDPLLTVYALLALPLALWKRRLPVCRT